MQVSVVAPKVIPAFEPVTLTILIETEDEFRALRGLHGASDGVANAVQRNACHLGSLSHNRMVTIYRAAFRPLEEVRVQRGLS